MATIRKRPGELNIEMIKGESFAFELIYDGDISADTITASVNNNGTLIPMAIVKTYSSVTQKTTINLSISLAQSATLDMGDLDWYMVRANRKEVAGKWTVF